MKKRIQPSVTGSGRSASTLLLLLFSFCFCHLTEPIANASTNLPENAVFAFSVIGNSQTAAVPFTVTISARDASNAIVSSFTGMVHLRGTNETGAVSVSPTNSGVFVAGQWSGSLTIRKAVNSMWLVADDGFGHAGTSSPFDVHLGPFHHFGWTIPPSPEAKDLPFPVTVAAQDAGDNTVTDFVGSVNFTATGSGSIVSIDDFESGWPHAPWLFVSGNPTGHVSTNAAHDAVYGLIDPEWVYRTDVQRGSVGNQLWWWVRTPGNSGDGAGRAYLGFAATSTGCWSFIASPNTGEIVLQQNTNYQFNTAATTNQVWETSTWYKTLVEFTSSNSVKCTLYDSDGLTVLNSLCYTNSSPLAGGIAIRSFNNWALDSLAMGQRTAFPMTPTSSGQFVGGVWTGSIAILDFGTNVELQASDGAGRFGASQQFHVVDLDTFHWQHWQLNFFGCLYCPEAQSNADPDGDGYINFAEYLLTGTDPTDSASAFQILEIAPMDEDMLITWDAVGGKQYIVQTATNLAGGLSNSFNDLGPVIVAPGTNEYPLSVLHLGGATNGPSRFYRVRLVP